ncbi:hypothetical protein OIE68_46145 [Nocardia vinacea]|uniref:hypothetical protein n=1 Tax=Nocardia vinacea TaxID=96468 RepID=UPI002E112A96|nr:hypothetical protein OIE68_46145 [Nocardia vinacea]
MPASTLVDPLCSDCSHPVTAATVTTTVEGERLCPDCATDVRVCDECAEPTRTTHTTTNATLLCERCVSGWSQCADCEEYSRDTRTALGDRTVCENCVDSYTTCDDCDSLVLDAYRVEGGNEVCDTCFDEDYRECCECCNVIGNDDLYCRSCAPPEHAAVHGYDYKPSPRFHGDGRLFLGLELEIKTPHDGFDAAVDTALTHIEGLAYLKEDSSIRPCGFELVTHPMSHEYARTRFPWQLLNQLRLLGCYTDSEVGIHIHLSRDGFDSPAHAYRWLKFIYRNEIPVTTLARRSSSWAVFSPSARSHVRDYAKGDRSAARYEAVNVRPTDTFELRIFASSLKPQQVQAALAFAAGSVEYTRRLTPAAIARHRGWEWTAFTTWLRGRTDYSPLLAELEDLACAS